MTNRASDFNGYLYHANSYNEQGNHDFFLEVPRNNFEHNEFYRVHQGFPSKTMLDSSNFYEDEPLIKKKRWKKPEGMPKRPQSAYNLFFQLERARLLNNEPERTFTKEDVDRIADQQKEKNKQPLVKRKHRKTHGKIGFGDLARTIANTWKAMDASDKIVFEKRAAIEKKEYLEAVEKWNAEQCREIKRSNEEPRSLVEQRKPRNAYSQEVYAPSTNIYVPTGDELFEGGDRRYRRGDWYEGEHTLHPANNSAPSSRFNSENKYGRKSAMSHTEAVPDQYLDTRRAQVPHRPENRSMPPRLPYRFYFGPRREERTDFWGPNSSELELMRPLENNVHDSEAAPNAGQLQWQRNFPCKSNGQRFSHSSRISGTGLNESIITVSDGPETPEEEYQMSVILRSFERVDK